MSGTATSNAFSQDSLGNLNGASKFIEGILAKAMTLLIDFLGRLLGLSGIGKAVRDTLEKIRAPIDKAVGKAVGFIVGKVSAAFGVVKEWGGKVAEVGTGIITGIGDWFRIRETFAFANRVNFQAGTYKITPKALHFTENPKPLISTGVEIPYPSFHYTSKAGPAKLATITMSELRRAAFPDSGGKQSAKSRNEANQLFTQEVADAIRGKSKDKLDLAINGMRMISPDLKKDTATKDRIIFILEKMVENSMLDN